jgi:hypothetical protein
MPSDQRKHSIVGISAVDPAGDLLTAHCLICEFLQCQLQRQFGPQKSHMS